MDLCCCTTMQGITQNNTDTNVVLYYALQYCSVACGNHNTPPGLPTTSPHHCTFIRYHFVDINHNVVSFWLPHQPTHIRSTTHKHTAHPCYGAPDCRMAAHGWLQRCLQPPPSPRMAVPRDPPRLAAAAAAYRSVPSAHHWPWWSPTRATPWRRQVVWRRGLVAVWGRVLIVLLLV